LRKKKSSLTDCTKNDTNNLSTETPKTGEYLNGMRYFSNIKDIITLSDSLRKLTSSQLKAWNEQQQVKTLYTSFRRIDDEASMGILNIPDSATFEEERRYRINDADASLLNENGMMMYGDTIVVANGRYTYYVGNKDLSLANKIADGAVIGISKKVRKKQHCFLLNLTRPTDGRMKSPSLDARTETYRISSKSRAYVCFTGEFDDSWTDYVRLKIIGRYQKKVLFWLTPTNASLEYGCIDVTGYVDGVPYTNSTGYQYDQEIVEMNIKCSERTPININIVCNYKRYDLIGPRNFTFNK
jgi:hypothetical protein